MNNWKSWQLGATSINIVENWSYYNVPSHLLSSYESFSVSNIPGCITPILEVKFKVPEKNNNKGCTKILV